MTAGSANTETNDENRPGPRQRRLYWTLVVILLFAVFKFIQLFLLAFSDLDLLAISLIWISVILSLSWAIREYKRKDVPASITIICAAAIAFAFPWWLGSLNMIAEIYRVELHVLPGYSAECKPSGGISIDHASFRVCRKLTWDHLEVIASVIKFDGNNSVLTDHLLDAFDSKNDEVRRIAAPFGVLRYDYAHITDDYFLVFFFYNAPVLTSTLVPRHGI